MLLGAAQNHCPKTKHAWCHPYLPSVGWGQVKWKQGMESLVFPSKPAAQSGICSRNSAGYWEILMA